MIEKQFKVTHTYNVRESRGKKMANTITTNENTRNAMDLNNIKSEILSPETVDTSYTLSENAVIDKFGADGKAFVNVARFTKAVDFVTLERIYEMSLHDFKNGYKDNHGVEWKSAIEYIKAIIEMTGGSMDKGTISAYIKIYTLFFKSALPEGVDEKVFDEKVRKFSVTALLHISRIKSGFGSMVEFIMNESPTMTISKVKETIKEKYTPIEVKPRENGNENSNENGNENSNESGNGNGNGNGNEKKESASLHFDNKKQLMEWLKGVEDMDGIILNFVEVKFK